MSNSSSCLCVFQNQNNSNDLDRAIYVFSILASRRDCQGKEKKEQKKKGGNLSEP